MTCIIIKPLRGGVVSNCNETNAEICVPGADEVLGDANIEVNPRKKSDELSGKVAETTNEQNDKCENMAANVPSTVMLALAEEQERASEETVPDLQSNEMKLKTDDINLEKGPSTSEVV